MIFCTAVIDIVDQAEIAHKCRVMLNSCAESHFLSERLCKRIGLPTRPISIPLRGTNAMTSEITEITQARIKSRHNRYSSWLTFLIAKEVSQPLPHDTIDRKSLDIPAGIHLAGPEFHVLGEIDGIIGGEYFWNLVYVGRVVLANRYTKLQKTQLESIVVGRIPGKQTNRPVTCNLTLNALQTDLNKFWDIDECPSIKLIAPTEQACEDHYNSHTARDPVTGRYTVSLPFNDQKAKIGETYQMALQRFMLLERSLNRNPRVKG